MSSSFRLGIDVGGTFTDAVIISETTGESWIAKVPSTPRDPSIGFLNAVDAVLSKTGLDPGAAKYLVHGTTVATNALIEGKTPKTAFITTAGFGDMLEIARQVRPSLYDVHFEKPRPLVSRDLCYEVPERLDASGTVLSELDESRLLEIAAALKKEGVGSAAVCFLHSYLNPAHEIRARELLLEGHPRLAVSLSSEVLPEFREYFRASTTVVNACLQPVVTRYLNGIASQLQSRGIQAELLVMQSNGGVLSFDTASEKPVYMVESGPAAGVIAANYVAEALGCRNLISLDMGGTTTKAGLILDGQPKVTKEYEVGSAAVPGIGEARGSGYPIRTPVIDLVEIGAGGGSIAWVDSGGILRVGPQSAGADPGPICYGKGGQDPTITDANLVLGRLDPHHFLGGDLHLDRETAREGVRRKCAEPLGMDTIAAANGIVEIANAAMINALRLVSVRRGYDPRELAMVAFGGAAPLHANRLAAEMQIPLLVIPPSPGTTSALGLLVTDLKHVFSHTQIMQTDRLNAEEVGRIFETMEDDGRRALSRDGVPSEQTKLLREIEARYVGQSHELPVMCPEGPVREEILRKVIDRFHQEHDRAYGHGYTKEVVEFVNFRVVAVGTIGKPKLREWPAGDRAVNHAERERRPVYFGDAGGFLETAIYERSGLLAGHRLAGPAIVEEMDSTSLIQPGFTAEVDRFGNLLVRASS